MFKKSFKTFCGKNHSVSEGLKGGPFEHTKTFFHHKMLLIFFTIHKNVFNTNSEIFSQKYEPCIIKYELGSKFFLPSDLAYKLVNLLVFEKIMYWDSTLPMNLKSGE